MIADLNDDEDGVSERYCPFELPYDEYGDMMFERRLATEGSLSPVMSRHADSRRGSTVADTDGKSCDYLLGPIRRNLTII